jgi:hypothetical protein
MTVTPFMAEPFPSDCSYRDVSFTENALPARAQGKLPLRSPVSAALQSRQEQCLARRFVDEGGLDAGARHLVDLRIAEAEDASDASSYSRSSEVWKKGGSSELMVTRTPACFNARSGCDWKSGNTFSAMLEPGQTSSTVP